MREPVTQQGSCVRLEWAVCATAYLGEQRSGDAYLVQGSPGGVDIAVVDGLGHGDEAADVAERALESLRQTAGHSPVDRLTACHAALRGSRGAVITVAAVDPEARSLVWVAVGNVEAAVVGPGLHGRPSIRTTVPLRGGVVGDRLPPLRGSTAALADGDILVWATDGVSPAFLDAVDLSLPPPALARALHEAYARDDDDALVLVARTGQG